MVTNNEGLADGEQWADALVKRAGEAAKALRGKRSAKWLSDRTAALGYRLSPQVIARLDSGRRAGHLEVAELMVLAAALEVPPVLLLYPDLPDGQVGVLPGVRTTSFRAALWFGGEEPLTDDEDPSEFLERDESRPLVLARIRRMNARSEERYVRDEREARERGDTKNAESLHAMYETLTLTSRYVIQQMRAAGMTVTDGEADR